ncbi:MAG: hypothetical protein F6J99_03270 [Moorea sp. SIO4G3]|nr:hypothetical protein [Moorena sp. SIO4G3]
MPTCQPANLPTCQPWPIGHACAFNLPTCQPVNLPTCQPANLPTCQPANLPTCQPTNLPYTEYGAKNLLTFEPSTNASCIYKAGFKPSSLINRSMSKYSFIICCIHSTLIASWRCT